MQHQPVGWELGAVGVRLHGGLCHEAESFVEVGNVSLLEVMGVAFRVKPGMVQDFVSVRVYVALLVNQNKPPIFQATHPTQLPIPAMAC